MAGVEPFDFKLRQFAHVGIGLVQHRLGLGQLVGRFAIVAVLRHHIGKIAVRFRDFAILLAVADYGGIRHLRGEFLEMLFELIEFAGVFHCSDDAQAMTSSPPCFASSAIAPLSA